MGDLQACSCGQHKNTKQMLLSLWVAELAVTCLMHQNRTRICKFQKKTSIFWRRLSRSHPGAYPVKIPVKPIINTHSRWAWLYRTLCRNVHLHTCHTVPSLALCYNNFLFTVQSTWVALLLPQKPPFHITTRYRYHPEAACKLNLLTADIRKHRTLKTRQTCCGYQTTHFMMF